MKKTMKTLLAVACAATLGVSALALTACGGSKPAAAIEETYIGTATYTYTITQYGMNVDFNYVEQLQLLDDGTYRLTRSGVGNTVGGAMTQVVYATGSYSKKEKSAKYDGYTEIELGDANYILLNQNGMGMFSVQAETGVSTFPFEAVGGNTYSEAEFKTEFGTFGSRFIQHPATVGPTNCDMVIVTEDDVEVVE